MLGQRLRNEEIAGLLGCSEATVADHRKRIMQKLELHHIEEVIDFATRYGVVYAPPAKHELSTRSCAMPLNPNW